MNRNIYKFLWRRSLVFGNLLIKGYKCILNVLYLLSPCQCMYDDCVKSVSMSVSVWWLWKVWSVSCPVRPGLGPAGSDYTAQCWLYSPAGHTPRNSTADTQTNSLSSHWRLSVDSFQNSQCCNYWWQLSFYKLRREMTDSFNRKQSDES